MSTKLESRTPAPTVDALRALHAELAERSRAGLAPERYFADFIAAVVHALGASSGSVRLAEQGRLIVVAEQGLDAVERAVFDRLARETLREGVGRYTAREDKSRQAVLTYPIRIGTRVLGVVSLGFADEPDRAAQATLQRTLVPLCDHAADYLHSHSHEGASNGEPNSTTSASLAEFALEIHGQLDLRRTASAIANETRRLSDRDRAGVCTYRRRRAEAIAVSGQDYLDRRANLIRRLEALAAAVAACGEPLRFPFAPDEQLAPQVETALHAYLEESQARALDVIPLRAGPNAADEIIGILTIEQIATAASPATAPIPQPHILSQRGSLSGRARSRGDEVPERDDAQLIEQLVPHAAAALANAIRYDSVPLRTLTRPLATIDDLTGGSKLKKRLLGVGALVGLVAALWLVPYDFAVEARGTLQPVHRRDVFASTEGIVDKILVRHGDEVVVGQPLFELRSTELDVAEADLIKEINETEQEFANAERQYNDGRNLTPLESQRLVGQMATLEQRRAGLRRRATLFTEKRAKLKITSPIVGQVATWNIEELLDDRPVKQGQTLVGLVDPAGPWEVEIRVPEDRFGHVAERLAPLKQKAANDGTIKPELKITFVLATDPGHKYEGTVVESHLAAEPRGDEGNVVLVRATIDKTKLAHLHPGADVRVRVECGSRSLGYVLLHDVWNFVQSRVLFKL